MTPPCTPLDPAVRAEDVGAIVDEAESRGGGAALVAALAGPEGVAGEDDHHVIGPPAEVEVLGAQLDVGAERDGLQQGLYDSRRRTHNSERSVHAAVVPAKADASVGAALQVASVEALRQLDLLEAVASDVGARRALHRQHHIADLLGSQLLLACNSTRRVSVGAVAADSAHEPSTMMARGSL